MARLLKMNRNYSIVFSLILLVFLSSSNILFAQQSKKILTRAHLLEYDENLLPGAQRLLGNVVFQHENTIGYCDSAYYYEADNYLIAFGKPVRIHIGDSVKLYGKKVYYDGNDKVASIAREVKMVHATSTLYSDSLIYNLNTDVGYYVTGGTMINVEDTLTSEVGHYYTKTDEALLENNVELHSASYTMNCDSLRYNTKLETVFFISRTKLVSDENTIYTNSGWYETKMDRATLVDSVELMNTTQCLTADSVYYDKNLRFGIGWNNVVIVDTAKGYVLKGNYVEHHEKGGASMATDSNLIVLIDSGDSLFLHSDTLRMWTDTAQQPQIITAYNKVKFFRGDLQGACDSLAYNVTDSLLYMFFNPVVWSGNNQLTADTIRFFIKDSNTVQINMIKSAFIVCSEFEETEFDQVKGVYIEGWVKNNRLTEVNVLNNAECVYYIMDEDSALIGVNTSQTSEMKILFTNNEIDGIIYYNAPDGNIFPDKDVTAENRILKDFRWMPFYRPKSIEDIYRNPIPRVKGSEQQALTTSDTSLSE